MAQKNDFPVQLTAPTAAGTLLFERMSGAERLSEPYAFEVSVLSERRSVSADDLLGQDVSLSIELPNRKHRSLHGFVTRFVRTGDHRRGAGSSDAQLYRYQLRLQPWFWFLTRTSDCRIFQRMTVPDIFKAVAKKHGFDDYKLSLIGTYPARDYCVQYRETDFNFLSRLLEEAGISYFFEHEADKHTMVLVDDGSRYQSADSYAEVPYYEASGARATLDGIDGWWVENRVQSGVYTTTDFDFSRPKLSLLKSKESTQSHARQDYEMFDYPANPEEMTVGAVQQVAKLRLEESQAAFERFHGTSSGCAGLQTGAKFMLRSHPDFDGRQFIIVGTEHSIISNQYSSGGGTGHQISVSVEAIDAGVQFRPPRVTPKPVIQGAQTAMVVGRSGEEIDTDQYGRVRVQFPWDRVGKKDENSSCWMRVAQLWAGEKWGAIHTPRIGQEVLVSFLEGDPDRPIITGRVYNGEAMPPYTLPDEQTKSGIKSNSSKGGGGSNEIRFEDKTGSEEFYVHAQKDFKKLVGNDQTVDIDKDCSTSIGGDCSTSISGNDSLQVKKDQNVKVTQNFVLEADQKIVLKSGQSQLTMNMDGTIELKGMSITIEGTQAVTCKVMGSKVALDPVNVNVAATNVKVQGQADVAVSGTMLDLNASASATLKGAITMVG